MGNVWEYMKTFGDKVVEEPSFMESTFPLITFIFNFIVGLFNVVFGTLDFFFNWYEPIILFWLIINLLTARRYTRYGWEFIVYHGKHYLWWKIIRTIWYSPIIVYEKSQKIITRILKFITEG